MAERPTDVPEWASDPPANTITTPSSQQREEGWQPLQAQVERVQVTTVANTTLYRATINGANHDYTSDGSATATEIRDGLRTAINAGAEPVTAANDGADALTLTADVAGDPFTLAVTANLTRATTAENSTGRPRRQFMNWLSELVYRWILFLRDAVFRSSDIAPDQAFGGAAPAAAAGLVVAANSFRASGYVDGYRVAEAQAPAHTYAATSDTYWDLGRDGVWRTAVVTSGDPEPAVTSSPPSVRVFRVRTNATDRTLVDDRRRARVALSGALDVLAGLRLGVDRDEFTAATVTTIPGDGVGATYSLIDQWTADLGGPNEHSVRIYVTGTVADRRVIIVHGAVWQGGAGDPWLAEVDDPRRMDLMPVLRTSRMVGVNAGDTFNDSAWWSAGDNLLSVGSSTNITGNASATGSLAVGGALNAAGATTLAGASATSLAVSGAASVGGNATVTGTLGVTGATTLGAAAASSLAVSGAASAASAAVSGALTAGSATVSGDALVGGRATAAAVALGSMAAAVPPQNVFDSANITKAWVLFTIGAAGAITVAQHKNVASVALVGTDGLRITFQRSFGLGQVPVINGIAARDDTPSGLQIRVVSRSDSQIDIQLMDVAVVQTLNGGSTAFTCDLSFDGRQ